jgi:ATP-dependent Clp protease ATP-binding subunit ClpC
MFEHLTVKSKEALVRSNEQALDLKSQFFGTEHLLLGLLTTEGVAQDVLTNLGITYGEVLPKVVAEPSFAPVTSSQVENLPFTPNVKKVLEFSLREALMLGHSHVGTEHLLLGLVRQDEGSGSRIIVTFGVELRAVRSQVIEIITSSNS